MAFNSPNNSFTLLDYILGRTGREGPSDNFGFLFTQTAGRTTSGTNVTVETVLSEPTTMNCIDVIARGVTQIPIIVRKKNDLGGYDEVEDHPLSTLLRQPNVYQTPTDFKYSMIETILVHGNCFLRIIRANDDPQDGMNVSGRPVQLVPMDPTDVTTGQNGFGIPIYHHDEFGDMSNENIIHIRDLNTFTANGQSRTLLAAELIGAKLAADELMAEIFRDGLNLGYVVTSDEPTDADTKKEFVKQMSEAFSRQGDRRGGMAFIDNGNIQPIKGATPVDADLRALRQELKNEIAAVFRVPSFMVGGTGDERYNNVRQRLSSFHRDTLQPIITNIEEAMTMKLLNSPDEKIYFDVTDFIKGDIESQGSFASQMVSNGIWTPNEARDYIGTNRHESELADQLIPPNSTVNTNLEETPANATGGSDGPQGEENITEADRRRAENGG